MTSFTISGKAARSSESFALCLSTESKVCLDIWRLSASITELQRGYNA